MRPYDLVIVGAGPAGMTAAIYGKRANLDVLLLDRLAPGGQIVNTNLIENYTGVANINGAELAMQMVTQCEGLGVEMDYKTVNRVEVLENGNKRLHWEEDEDTVEAPCIIFAVGTSPNMLHIPGELDLAGKTVSWCAICDGAKFRDQEVVVIGGGNSAIDEGTYLASITKHLTVVTDFDLTGDPTSAAYLRSLPNVTVYPYKRVLAFEQADGKLTGVRFCDKETGENEQVVAADGAFEYIGASPNTGFLRDLGICESHGFVEHDEHMRTKIPGVFAAGDSNSKFLRQIVTATNDGAIAAQEAAAYLKNRKKTASVEESAAQ